MQDDAPGTPRGFTTVLCSAAQHEEVGRKQTSVDENRCKLTAAVWLANDINRKCLKGEVVS